MFVSRHLSLLLSVCALAMLVHGCGFQLRGSDLGELNLDYRITGNLTGGGADATSAELVQHLDIDLLLGGASL